MEYNSNFKEALDEAIEWVATNYSSPWEGDVLDFYALLIKARFNNNSLNDYLKEAIKGKAYLPKGVSCIINKDRITKITIGG